MNTPTVQEKNVAIAEMLKLVPLNNSYEGAFTTDNNTHNASFYSQYMPDESWYVYPKFHSNANWQFEAIEWVENLGYKVDVCLRRCGITENNITDKKFKGISKASLSSKKEAIFEALYQFSQYLKEKK